MYNIHANSKMDIEQLTIKRRRGRPSLNPEEREQRKRERYEANKDKNRESRRKSYIIRALQDPNHRFLTTYTEEEKQAALAQKERGKGRPKQYTEEQMKQNIRDRQNRVNREKRKNQEVLLKFIEAKKDEFKQFIESKI